MTSVYNQIKLEQEGKESFQFFTSAKHLANTNISLDDKLDEADRLTILKMAFFLGQRPTHTRRLMKI